VPPAGTHASLWSNSSVATTTIVDTGVHGNTIYSFLQTFHSGTTNPVRRIEVDTAADSVRTWITAPFDNTSFPQYDRTFTGIGLVR
jgi:hypothetical protein